MWGVFRFVTPLVDLYGHCLVLQSAVEFCLGSFIRVLLSFSVMFMSVLYSVVEVLFRFLFAYFCNVDACFVLHHVQFFVFFNVSNVHVCFAVRHRIVVQFFFAFINFSNVYVCFVFCYVQSFLFINFSNVHVSYAFLLQVLVMYLNLRVIPSYFLDLF